MFKKTNEKKVMRDVIHGYIHVDYQIVWDLINTREFQRLRRISQLGGVFQVYHNAEHTRFSHSLGVYEIVRRMVNEVEDLQEGLSLREKLCVMIAGLLHDIGHYPFSHAFENVSTLSHEQFTTKIILEDSEIHRVFMSYDECLAQEVASVIQHNHNNPILNQIISGQLDADRMDYLLRDAYFSGTSYGRFDLERVLRTLRVRNQLLVVKESGIHSVEDYIMARYHMYWQVYYHPIARSFEIILYLIFKRMREKNIHDTYFEELGMFKPFVEGKGSVQDHFMLDEHAAYYGFGLMLRKNDPILADLCLRILDRKLFEYETYSKDNEDHILKKLEELGYDVSYYIYIDKMSKNPYSPYAGQSIYVLMRSGEVKELSSVSNVVSGLVNTQDKERIHIFSPIKM